MKKKILVAILVYVMCLLLAGCACKHDWVEATCTEPKTCSKCGETEGEPLGHTPGEWEIWNTDYVSTMVWLRQPCTVCEEDVNTDMKALNSLVEDGKFLFSADEFVDRIDYIFRYYDELKCSASMNAVDGETLTATIANENNKSAATVIFIEDSENIINDKYDRSIKEIMIGFETSNTAKIEQIVTAVVMTVDPYFDYDDAVDACTKIVNGSYVCNGIKYAIGKVSDYNGTCVMTVIVE